MDEKYILSLYNYLSSQDVRFKSSLSKDAFISSMKDPGYASDIYGYLSSKDPSLMPDELKDKSSLSEDAFLSEVGASKKKDESASTATEEASASESQQPQETTTSGTSQPVQVELPQFDVYESDATTVSQPGLTFEQPQFGGRRVLEPIKPYDAFQVIPFELDRTTVSQPGLVVDTDPVSEITKTIGQIEPVQEQQTFPPSPISRPRVTTSMDVPTLTEQDIADLEQARKEQAEAEARTKLIELGQPDAEEIIQPDAAPADATGVVRPDLEIPEEREITIQELAGRQSPSDPSPFEPAAVDATFSQTAADIAKIDPSEEAVQKRIEEEEKEFAEDQLKRQLGIFSLEDNTLIEDVFGKNTVTNFIGDIYRSAGQGQAQGAVVDDAIALMRKGPNATDADIMQFIEAYDRMLESGVSDEMQDFNKIYEESGGGLVGFWNGFKSNPSVFPQLFVSSASAMFNPASLVAGAAAAGTGFLVSGPGGAAVLGIGAVSSALESALTYAELLQEEIGVNTPMTIENVRAVLSQPGIQNRLTWKSTGRGLTIGAIEGLTAGLGVKATSLVTGRTGSQLAGGLAGTVVEGAGGATGEFLGRKVAGQADDFLEVAFEGTVGGITTAPFTVTRGLMDARNKGEYKINDGVATQEQVISLLETGTDADIAGTKLDIQNDPELRTAAEDAKARVRNNAEIKAELAQAGVIDNNKADAIVPLEVEKQGLSGNTTEAGKRRLKEINDQINSILDEPTEVTTETEAVRIYEGKDKDGNTKQVKLTTQESGRIRLDIVNDDGSTSLIGDFPAESTDTDVVSGIIDTDQDFNIVKPQDAIQESSTETVDVQEPARDSEAVGEGDATGPVTAEVEAEVQVEETPSTLSEEAAALRAELGIAEAAPAVTEETTVAETTTEAAPAVTEETVVTEEDRPLTDEEREFMYESNRKSALNGLAYREDYISDILENIYGELRTRSFNALWRKHVDPYFTGDLQIGRGKNFSDYVVSEMIYDRGFATDVTADENGMQKLIDFINDANKKIAKKGGQTVDLVPLERTAPVTEETTVTETTTEAAPAAELTEEQREFMYETRQRSGIDGLAYSEDYINDILYNILGDAGSRTFAALWRKHVDPNFTKYLIEPGGGMTFDLFISDELSQGAFSQDLTSQENGMQKLIDLVNDANKRLEKKGKQTIDLVPLERTAPAVTEAAPVTEETATVAEEAAPVAEEIEVKPTSFRDAVFKEVLEGDIRKAKSEIQLSKEEIEDRKTFVQKAKDNLPKIKEDKDLSPEEKELRKDYIEKLIKELPSFISKKEETIKFYEAELVEAESSLKNLVKKSPAEPAVTEAAPAPKPKKKTPAPKKKAPAPKESKPFIPREIELKLKENQEDIDRLESDISYSENRIEDLEMEIELEKGNTKEEKKNFAAKRAAIKDLKISREEKAERREELKFEQEDFVEDQQALIQSYKEDISGEKSDIRASQRKINNLKKANEKLQAGTRMQRATAPTSTDNLTITGVEEKVSESQNNLIKLTKNAAKAISKVLPDTKFIYHRSEQSYNNAVSENAQGSQGAYIPRTNTIHINGVKANNRTAAHEAFHALLKNKIGSDPKIEAATKKMIVTVRQSVKDKSVQAELDNFIAQYDQRFQDEEYLSELMGMLSQNYTKLNAPEKSTIRKWIESIARLFGLDKIFNIDSDQGVIDLLNVVSQRIQEGKALEEAEVGTIQSQIEGQERQQQTPAQQVARLAAMYNIEESGFLSEQINPGILRPQLRRLGYDLKKERFGYSIRDGRGKMYKPPTGRGRMQRGSIVPAEVQSKNVAGTKVPKGLSIRSVDGQPVVQGVDNMSVAKVREAAPLTFIKNANFLRELDLVKGSKKFRPLPIPKSEKALRLMSPAKRRALLKRADEIYDIFVKQVSDNLVFIHDLYGDEFREISTLWYDGANQIAQGLAEKHNVSLEQVSGILASLSPQKDWYQNVRLAELVLEQYDTNPVFTQEALDTQKEINERAVKAALKKNKGRLTEKGKKNKANAEKLLVELEGLIGKRLKDVEPKYQPYVLRTTQEITGQKDYQIVSPDGERVGVAKKNDGTNAKVAWGSYTEIGKAVAIYLNGSPENISTQLGTAHKIRNFYDNIVDPMSEEGEVTMDTHAVAAATLLPLSGNSIEVAQNFGTKKASSSNAAGVSGVYYAYADAYADAAKRTGLLPRQMQSVTWEAVRGLFTDSFKNSKKNVNDVRNIFSNYAQGKITIDEARKQAVDRAGGIQDPSWAGSLLSDVTRDIEAESDIRGVRRDERSDERSRTERGREVDSQRDVRSERDDLTEGAERLQKSIRKEANAIDVINRAREMKKISAAAIREVLTTSIKDKESDKFLSVAQANALLELEFETALPRSFAEINISDGISLLQKINEYKKNLDSERKSLEKKNKSSISKKEKLTERLEALDGKPDTKANKEKQSQLTSEIKDLNREIREQNKKLKDLTPTKIKSRTLLFLEAQPEYQKLADKGRTTRSTQQQKLYVDTTESLKAPTEKLPKGVPAQIRKMKSDIRQRAKGAKDLQSVKQELKNYISKNLPKVLFSRAEVNSLLTQLNRVKRTTLDLFISEVQIMLDNKEKQVLIKKITDIVKKKASKQITKTGKERSKGLDARGQQFFAAVRSILNLSVTQNRTDKVVAENQKKLQEKIQKLQQPEVEVAGEKINVKETLDKASKNEKLSQRENALINQMLAIDLFADIENKSVDQVRELLKSLEDVRSESIKQLMSNRLERANRRDALATEATLEIKEDRPILFDEQGNLKNKNQLEFDRRSIWESFNEGKLWTGLDKWVKQYPLTTGIGIAELFKNHLSHLNTLMNLIDNLPRGNNFFTENVYNRVNKMHTEHIRGTQKVRDVDLNDLANKVDGIEGGYKGLIKSIPQGAREFIINGKKNTLTVGELMSINALSRNSIVRNKLDKMGFTDDVLNQIENEIGPQMVQFISNVVEWLSNSYHQTIDDVYVEVNDVNLAVIPNYFPTSTLGENVADLVSDGDFAGVFNAEYFSSFKRRTDTDGVVEIVNRDFFDVLETYIDEMERFKAYAEGTKILNDIFKVPAVRTLMDETGITSSAKNILNIAINPKSGLNSSISSKVIGNALQGYTSYVLSFKLIQLPKQATSFIQNYEQYVYSKDGKRRVGVDMLGFAADTLKVFANFRSVFKDAYNLSPDFRDRWEQGMKGDVYGLETGGRLRKFESVSKASRKYRQAINTTRMAAASPTILGDIAGVLPAMATYYRNIENGMPQDQALRIFADYNATQQSRRTADKTNIQLSQTEVIRVYTMFGSVTLLQLNKVMMAMTNLMKSAQLVADGKSSKISRNQVIKDVRSVTLNLGVANVLFYTMANIARLHGDDEDKEAVLDILGEALMGMNLIYQIPLVGDGAQQAIAKIKDKPYRFREKPNPYSLIFRLLVKDAEETKELNLTKPAEVLLGINLDPFVALYNYAGLSGDPGEMDDLYTIMGISPSYRPGGGKKKKSSGASGGRGGNRGSRSGRGGRSTRR